MFAHGGFLFCDGGNLTTAITKIFTEATKYYLKYKRNNHLATCTPWLNNP
jgi:hypothetical protein